VTPTCIRLLSVIILVAGCVRNQAADFGLDNGPLLRPLPDLEPRRAETFFEKLSLTFDQRSGDVFADRLHPLKLMEWRALHLSASSGDFREYIDHAAGRALGKSFEYSLRDAAADLPLFDWLGRGPLSGLVVDSVDAVEEESVSPFSLSASPLERTWWQSLASSGALRYGLRPLRADPYAFLGLRLSDHGETLMLGHVRYYFKNLTDHKFELALSFPLPGGAMLDLGTFYQFGQNEEVRRTVVRFFQPLRHGAIAQLGVEIAQVPTVFAGISVPL
jgi:hypothetical protein